MSEANSKDTRKRKFHHWHQFSLFCTGEQINFQFVLHWLMWKLEFTTYHGFYVHTISVSYNIPNRVSIINFIWSVLQNSLNWHLWWFWYACVVSLLYHTFPVPSTVLYSTSSIKMKKSANTKPSAAGFDSSTVQLLCFSFSVMGIPSFYTLHHTLQLITFFTFWHTLLN